MLTIDEAWSILESHVNEYSFVRASELPSGASQMELRAMEAKMNLMLPHDLVSFLSRHNGSGRLHVFPYQPENSDQRFLDSNNILYVWELMVELGEEFENMGQFGEQAGPIKRRYWNASWIPFADDGCGDNIVIDLDPAPGGDLGQIVDWCHETGSSRLLAPSLRAWFDDVAKKVQSGIYHFRIPENL